MGKKLIFKVKCGYCGKVFVHNVLNSMSNCCHHCKFQVFFWKDPLVTGQPVRVVGDVLECEAIGYAITRKDQFDFIVRKDTFND